MKTTVINIRVDEQTREFMETYAQEEQISLSEYIRNMLLEHIDYREEDNTDENTNAVINFSVSNTRDTYRFTHLVTWLFAKYMFPLENNPKEYLCYLKSLLEDAMNDTTIYYELKLEFNKVLSEINTILVDPDYKERKLEFPVPHTPHSFDYVLMINEILGSEE